MNEAYEVELDQIKASFVASPFDLVLGVEKLTTLKVDEEGDFKGLTDVEWQVVYMRVQIDGRWYFLPHTLHNEIDEVYADMIGDKLWQLTQTV